MSISETVEQLLLANQFKPARVATKKKSSWVLPVTGQVFYINRTSTNGASLFIFHPEKTSGVVAAVKTAGLDFNEAYYHSSNMSLFPRHMHRGVNPIPYGWSVNALDAARMQLLVKELAKA
ncbi:MAG TPA: hypothetical protein VFV28_02355 [Limnobacter sp.]|nr:hypothetical protein [Limnobacter sp.]